VDTLSARCRSLSSFGGYAKEVTQKDIVGAITTHFRRLSCSSLEGLGEESCHVRVILSCHEYGRDGQAWSSEGRIGKVSNYTHYLVGSKGSTIFASPEVHETRPKIVKEG
jgi:hypothetical protein